jgi:hypothetical protein
MKAPRTTTMIDLTKPMILRKSIMKEVTRKMRKMRKRKMLTKIKRRS